MITLDFQLFVQVNFQLRVLVSAQPDGPCITDCCALQSSISNSHSAVGSFQEQLCALWNDLHWYYDTTDANKSDINFLGDRCRGWTKSLSCFKRSSHGYTRKPISPSGNYFHFLHQLVPRWACTSTVDLLNVGLLVQLLKVQLIFKKKISMTQNS